MALINMEFSVGFVLLQKGEKWIYLVHNLLIDPSFFLFFHLSNGAVSTSLCTFVNRSLKNLSYGAVCSSFCTFVN